MGVVEERRRVSVSKLRTRITMDPSHTGRLNVRLKPHASSAKLFFLTFLTVIFPAVNAVRYSAPSDCEWVKTGPGTIEMSLKCRSSDSSRDAGGMNFSHIDSMYTEKLRIYCEDVYYETHLTEDSFIHLPHLKSLKVENCKIASISSGALRGLPNLKNITIRTHNVQWGTLSLIVEPESFSFTNQLEWLDLSMNNLMSLPENIFSNLESLKSLNLARNKLHRINRLGFEKTLASVGLPRLFELDLSYNKIKLLPDQIFSSLKSLEILTIRDNKISHVSDSSFLELHRLQVLNLANNKLVQLPSQFVKNSVDMRELYLQNNSLTFLPLGIFDGLQQLVVLNLSRNHIESLGYNKEILEDLVRLVVLDLSYNQLRSINYTTFQTMHSLQILYLDHNEIETIADNAFSNLYNLHTLVLNHNNLRVLDIYTLNGLYVLSTLDLNNNHIHSIHNEAFKNCSNVQDLQLEENRLTLIPNAIQPLHILKTLNVVKNRIRDISNTTFRGVKQLLYLYAEKNEIGNLTRGILRDISNLKSIDLSHNKIENLEHGLFDDAPEIEVIHLNDNLLTDINGLFMNLHSLEFLNVSRNKITWFDYALLPIELTELDLHDNAINTLGNYYEMESQLQLKYIDASYNLITELNPASFPHQIEVIRINNNLLKLIDDYTFMPKENLTKVDLRHNKIQSLEINALRLKTVKSLLDLPEFHISENPYFCDCQMEWMQRLGNLDETGQYPKVMDLPNVVCQLPFPRQHAFLPLLKLNSSDFLCKYRAHCFALCHCCDFDACDCEMVCPENCTCFSDETWNTNIVECSFQGFMNIPVRIPMDATELYLDGNDMTHLSSHKFIGRKNLRVLYLNNSNVNNIPNRTFIGLQNLQILHLENNKLRALHGYEFENLTNLRELYLSHNHLQLINNRTFVSLINLRILNLDFNYIIDFQVWTLSTLKHLTYVRLSHNQWSCNCKFMEQYNRWLNSLGTYVIDAREIRCFFNSTPSQHLLYYNSSSCNNMTMVTYFQAVFSEDIMPLMIILPIVIIVLLLFLVAVCVYRHQVKIWLFNHFGIRIFSKTRYAPEQEKLFDAFVSYCKKDEAFVAQILAPELECANPSYRLCLCYRDLATSNYVGEAITEAVDSSHRTLAVISEQFLKNDWCRFELKTAFHETQCNKKHKLILILLDKICFKDLDPDARLCIRSSIVLQWGDRKFWQKLRYAMPEVRTHKGHITSSDPNVPSLKILGDSNNIKFV